MNNIMQFVENNWESIVAAVGGIIIVARVIVKLTPTPKDNALFDKLIKLLKHLGLYIPLLCLSFLTLSCAATFSGLTGTAIPATSVQRASQPTAPVILVASQDLARAEQAPQGTVHGLYNASALSGAVADMRGKPSK